MTSQSVQEILRSIQSGRPDVLAGGLHSLVGLKGEAVGPLIEALSGPEPLTRWAAAAALGELKDRRAIQPLVQALNDANPSVRVRAAQSLLRLGNTEGVPALISALEREEAMVGHPPELVADYANQVLESVTGQRLGFDVGDPAKRRSAAESWRQWWEGNRDSFRPPGV